MIPEPFELVMNWDFKGYSPIEEVSYNEIYEQIEFFNNRHYGQFIPTFGPANPDFLNRLKFWLNNVASEKDKQTLLEFVPKIIFYGREEFIQLYQYALRGAITRWIIDELAISFTEPHFNEKIYEEIAHHTWYCPITDSMPISEFYHANGIGGVEYRPDFRAVTHFTNRSPGEIVRFMENNKSCSRTTPLKRIVLLEDFVGNGTQIESAIEFATSISPDISVLFVPLIICPKGDEKSKELAHKNPNLQYEAVMLLDEGLFINHIRTDHTELQSRIKDLAVNTYHNVVGDDAANPRPYAAFGFRRTGACVVLFSNSPANTLPLIQHQSNTWSALFPRSARIR